jgi:hypothetical protein
VRYTYDLEFLDDGRTIDLISIGIVAEDGREYYAVSSEFDQGRVLKHSWLLDNVWPSLPVVKHDLGHHCLRCPEGGPGHLDQGDPDVRSRKRIAEQVRAFLLDSDTPPELWADYGAYDHVGLCQLWGPMNDLPEGLPMYTNDIQQEARRLGLDWSDLPRQESGNHNALEDARHNLVKLDYLQRLASR